jgi:hypothetical protein
MSVARESMQLRLFVVQKLLAELCECWSELRGVQVGMRMRGGALPGDSIIAEDPQDTKNGATSPSMAPQLPAMRYGSMQLPRPRFGCFRLVQIASLKTAPYSYTSARWKAQEMTV